MEKVKMPNGTEVAFEGAEWYMDNELRAELICDYGGVSDQEFINIYCQKHKERFGEEFSIETALVVCEIYRSGGDWKFNAVGAGYQGGLYALCKNYGVNV